MSETDKTKEVIGWLKLLLGLLVAAEIPLVAWVFGHSASASFSLRLLAFLFTCAIIAINFYAYWIIKKLGDL